MAEGFNGGPPRGYRRRTLAEHREAVALASAQLALLNAKEERIKAAADERIRKIDLQIVKVTQKEAKTTAQSNARSRGVQRPKAESRCDN